MDIFYNTGVNYIYIIYIMLVTYLFLYGCQSYNHICYDFGDGHKLVNANAAIAMHDFYRLHVGRYLENGKCNIPSGNLT